MDNEIIKVLVIGLIFFYGLFEVIKIYGSVFVEMVIDERWYILVMVLVGVLFFVFFIIIIYIIIYCFICCKNREEKELIYYLGNLNIFDFFLNVIIIIFKFMLFDLYI